MWLFGGTVPPNNLLFRGTVAGIVPPNDLSFRGTVGVEKLGRTKYKALTLRWYIFKF